MELMTQFLQRVRGAAIFEVDGDPVKPVYPGGILALQSEALHFRECEGGGVRIGEGRSGGFFLRNPRFPLVARWSCGPPERGPNGSRSLVGQCLQRVLKLAQPDGELAPLVGSALVNDAHDLASGVQNGTA